LLLSLSANVLRDEKSRSCVVDSAESLPSAGLEHPVIGVKTSSCRKIRLAGHMLEEDVSPECLVEMQKTIFGCESLLSEDVEVEAHFEDGEQSGDGCPNFSEESSVHEVKVVDCVG